jgi:preprotein translocase subunit SecF
MVELFKNIKVDWLGKRKLFLSISIALILLGMGSLVYKGRFRYGLDFKGGTQVKVRFSEPVAVEDIRRVLPRASIQTWGSSGNDYQIELEREADDQDATLGRELVTQALSDSFAGKFEVLEASGVSAKVGEDLRSQAVLATLLALGGILVYIAFRFEWVYGAAAVIAVFHDAIVTLGFFSLLDYEINLTVIAALLTLVGYSVNDTIVVFDRVRENLKIRRRDEFEAILNDSINQTLSRTLLTSGLTLFAVLALFLFGGSVINNFAFAMVVGVVVGSYSTIAVASPLVLAYENLRKRATAPAPAQIRGARPARVK